MELINKVEFDYESIHEAFPPIEVGVQPFGSRVLVQVRTPKKITKGGIHLLEEARETEHWNTQVAKVLACGDLAFRNRTTMDKWPEGSWCQPGDFVRIPKYGGDRWSVQIPGEEDVLVIMFNDLDLIGKVTDPLSVKAYI